MNPRGNVAAALRLVEEATLALSEGREALPVVEQALTACEELLATPVSAFDAETAAAATALRERLVLLIEALSSQRDDAQRRLVSYRRQRQAARYGEPYPNGNNQGHLA